MQHLHSIHNNGNSWSRNGKAYIYRVDKCTAAAKTRLYQRKKRYLEGQPLTRELTNLYTTAVLHGVARLVCGSQIRPDNIIALQVSEKHLERKAYKLPLGELCCNNRRSCQVLYADRSSPARYPTTIRWTKKDGPSYSYLDGGSSILE